MVLNYARDLVKVKFKYESGQERVNIKEIKKETVRETCKDDMVAHDGATVNTMCVTKSEAIH